MSFAFFFFFLMNEKNFIEIKTMEHLHSNEMEGNQSDYTINCQTLHRGWKKWHTSCPMRFGYWGSSQKETLSNQPQSRLEGRWEKLKMGKISKPVANWASTATEGLATYRKTTMATYSNWRSPKTSKLSKYPYNY